MTHRFAIAAFFSFLSASYALAATAPAVLSKAAPTGPTLQDAKPDQNGIHRLVVLRGLNKTTGRANDIAAPIGFPVNFGTLTITAFYCHTVPPEEPPETSAFLQVDDTPADGKKQRVFSGWMFAASPGLHGVEHPIYDIWLTGCRQPPTPVQPAKAEPVKPEPAKKPEPKKQEPKKQKTR